MEDVERELPGVGLCVAHLACGEEDNLWAASGAFHLDV